MARLGFFSFSILDKELYVLRTFQFLFSVVHGLSSSVPLFAGPAMDGARDVFRVCSNTQAIHHFDSSWSLGGIGNIDFA